MKLNEGAMAKALGVLGAAYFLACYFVAAVFPGLYKVIATSWFHMIDVSGLWKSGPDGFFMGLISFTVVSWISGWLIAWAYNRFTK